MKNPTRTTVSLLSLLVAAVAAGCSSAPGVPESSWNVESVPQRIVKHFTGYRGEIDGSYREYQWRKKQSINLTLRRHFLNDNPRNPLEVADPSVTAIRPPLSVLPDPVGYFHVESLVIGTVFLAANGTFLPIPVDSLLGTFSPGGWGEFKDGVSETFSSDWQGRIPEPAPPSEFKVKHR